MKEKNSINRSTRTYTRWKKQQQKRATTCASTQHTRVIHFFFVCFGLKLIVVIVCVYSGCGKVHARTWYRCADWSSRASKTETKTSERYWFANWSSEKAAQKATERKESTRRKSNHNHLKEQESNIQMQIADNKTKTEPKINKKKLQSSDFLSGPI